MLFAQPGDTVKIDFVGMLDDGTVFEKTVDKYPLKFTIGDNEVIPGLEIAVLGMSPGETKTARIPPEKGFGPVHKEMNLVIDRGESLEDQSPCIGDGVEIKLESGETLVATVARVSESTLTLDPNHPLAGKHVTFAIRLLEIAHRNEVRAHLNGMAGPAQENDNTEK